MVTDQIRPKGLSIREHVFVIRHGVGVQAGLVRVGTAHALRRRSGRWVVPGTQVAKDLLYYSRSGVARIGSSAVDFVEMWVGAQNQDCCHGGFEGASRNDG